MADEVKEPKVKKEIVSRDVDTGNGKIVFHTKGYANGETLKVVVNGKKSNVEIHDNHGVYASGGFFKDYPGITIE